jgi:hypothetical protein
MTIQCVACRRHIQIPDERAGNPRLKVKCTCGSVFMLQEAPIASGPAPAAATAPAAQLAAAASAPAPLSFQATATAGSRAVPAEPRGRANPSWRRCVNHPGDRSNSVCRTCSVGYCRECEHKVQNAVVCTRCETLCVPAADHEARLERDRRRAQPMMDELHTILTYPLRDVTAFISLAIFTGIFGALGHVSVLYGQAAAVLFSQGVLMAYCFTALSRVSAGNLQDFMPDIGDIHDLATNLRLGLAALVAGSGPLLLLIFLVPALAIVGGGVAHPPDAEQVEAPAVGQAGGGPVPVVDVSDSLEEDTAPGVILFLVAFLALVWKIVYTPMALTVAGLSRSILSTLNPVLGFDTMKRMGSVYWHAMGIYTVIALTQWVLGAVLGFIPIAGMIVYSFVAAYAYLMIGCTLGMAVFKKAVELGLD